MVIDEVQDMTPIEVVVLTLLVEFEEHESHRIMLAGDEYQTINGNDFAWDPWLYRLQALCRSLLDMVQRVYNKKSRNMGWHVRILGEPQRDGFDSTPDRSPQKQGRNR